jgi:hypothetical protein
VKCPHCQSDLVEAVPAIHSEAPRCNACDLDLSRGIRFCPHCGRPVSEPPRFVS